MHIDFQLSSTCFHKDCVSAIFRPCHVERYVDLHSPNSPEAEEHEVKGVCRGKMTVRARGDGGHQENKAL